MTLSTLTRTYVRGTWGDLTNEQQQILVKRETADRETSPYPSPWTAEILDSLKAVIKASGLTLADYDLGPHNRGNFLRVSGDEDALALSGPRALAWLENNLLGPLRIPWTGPKRRDLARYGRYYRPGLVAPCPFTGVYCDEDYLDALRTNLRDGMSIYAAYNALAGTAATLMENDLDAWTDPDNVAEDLANQDTVYEWEEGHPKALRQV